MQGFVDHDFRGRLMVVQGLENRQKGMLGIVSFDVGVVADMVACGLCYDTP